MSKAPERDLLRGKIVYNGQRARHHITTQKGVALQSNECIAPIS